MAKSLNDILKGVKKSTTTALTTGSNPGVDYAAKMKDTRDFVAQHSVEKHDDRNGNDNPANATKKAEMKRHGHAPAPKDEKVYNKTQQVSEATKKLSKITTKIKTTPKWAQSFDGYSAQGDLDRGESKRIKGNKVTEETVSEDWSRSALLPQDHHDAKNMSPEQKKAKHKKYLDTAAHHEKRSKDQSLTSNQRMASSSVATAAKMAAAEWKHKFMKEDSEQVGEDYDSKAATRAKGLKYAENLHKNSTKTDPSNKLWHKQVAKSYNNEYKRSIKKAVTGLGEEVEHINEEMFGDTYHSTPEEATAKARNAHQTLMKAGWRPVYGNPEHMTKGKNIRLDGSPTTYKKEGSNTKVKVSAYRGGVNQNTQLSIVKEAKACESCGKSPCGCDSDDEPRYGKKDKSGKRKLLTDKNIQEKLTKDMSAGDVIKDFQKSDDPRFEGDSKEKRKQRALAAYYKMKKEDVNEALSDQRSSRKTASEEARKEMHKAIVRKKEREDKMKEEAAASDTSMTFPATNSREGFRV